MSVKSPAAAIFRFYAELNDFLPAASRGPERIYDFTGHPSVKDAFEAQGVPHTEVELIVVNGHSVGFDYSLRDGDRVALFPVFESLDIRPLLRVREAPLRRSCFICDVHLGKLARWLRLLGFDAAYRNEASDREIVEQARHEQRIVLTRDRHLLQHKVITHGYWVRSTVPDEQVGEVVRRFQLQADIAPFSRCMECNGRVHPVPKGAVADQLEPRTQELFDEFFQCEQCRRLYWRGSHYERLVERIQKFAGVKPFGGSCV